MIFCLKNYKKKIIQFKLQQSVYFRHPFAHKIIPHKHMYCLKLFQYSFIHGLIIYMK